MQLVCRRYAKVKLTAVSVIFCLGQRVWRNPSVAAAAAALTDTYWGRLEEEKEAAAANPRWGWCNLKSVDPWL